MPPSEAGPEARAGWQGFLERHPATATVDLILPDLVGIPRGKRLSAAGFGTVLESGCSFATSVYGMDSTGANVDASGLIWEEGDADRPVAIDLATLVPVPWREGGAAVIGGLLDRDDKPFFADPRAVLRSVAARFAPLGLRPTCALELEFHLLERRRGRDGRPRLLGQRDLPALPGRTYDLGALEAADGFLARLGTYGEAQGLPAKAAVSEYSPAQLEINLGHVDDAVRAADHALMLKRAIKAAARAEGLAATFMAKPFAELSGNGMHLHLSLVDDAGSNRFADDEAALHHAIAGLQATMAEAMLLLAPNANSFRRLRPGSYAPTAPTWGRDNRTVALRIPAGAPAARRVEHRLAGADANPYLVVAAVLAGVHHGLERRLEPSAPTRGNAYAGSRPGLPLTWDAAIDTLARAEILPDYLGRDFCRLYRVCREAERDRFADLITPAEHAWYLETA